MVTVTAGANSEPFPGLVGKSVGEIRSAFATLYNIAPDASATLNGRAADESEILRENDNLVFAKSTAQKG